MVLNLERASYTKLWDRDTWDSMLTITGSEQEAQAMPCLQYIIQTWPTNGMLI